jgi:hypothetical protein
VLLRLRDKAPSVSLAAYSRAVMVEASDYYDREALDQADNERIFDLAATGLLRALAEAVTRAAELLPQNEDGASRPWTRTRQCWPLKWCGAASCSAPTPTTSKSGSWKSATT